MANFSSNLLLSGLGTATALVSSAGVYNVGVKNTLPTLSSGGMVSSVVTVINQNGTPVFTSVAGSEGAGALVNCATGDVITVVTSSAVLNDKLPNVVKSIISIG